MRHLIIILFLLSSANLFAQISGRYLAEDCDEYFNDCFYYSFHENYTFTYGYSLNEIGEFFLSGDYKIEKDTLILLPRNKFVKENVNIEYLPKADNEHITINIAMLPMYFGSLRDTMRMPYFVKVNNELEFRETDFVGSLEIENQIVNKLTIKEYALKFDLEEQSSQENQIIIEPKKQNCDYNIFFPSDIEPFYVPPVKKFLLAGKKIIALDGPQEANNPYFPKTQCYILEK